LRVICFADLHVGQKNYCKLDPNTGIYQREARAIRILNKIIDDAIDMKIDVVVFAGDMFKTSLMSPTLINKVNEAFLKLSNNNICTLVLDGNHDVSKMDAFSSGLHQFDTLEVPNIIQTRFFKEKEVTFGKETYNFVFLPTHHTKEEIINCVNQLDENKNNIIIGHLTIKDAFLNDWNIIDNETAIDKEIFENKNIIAVILGHLHKHQILSYKDPLMFYCGSADRIDFSEEKQEKGYVYLEIINNVVEDFKLIPINSAQKFYTLKMDFANETDAEKIEDIIINELSNHNLKNTIVRIKLKLDNDIKINEKKIISYLYEEKQIQYLLKIGYEIKNEVNTDNEISNSMPTFSAIEKYYEGQTRSDERIKLCKEIVNKVEIEDV